MYGEALSKGGQGFYESLLVFAYLTATGVIICNMIIVVFIEAASSSSQSLRHEELLQRIQSSAAATATVLAELQAKSMNTYQPRSQMAVVSSPSLRDKSRRRGSVDSMSPMMLPSSSASAVVQPSAVFSTLAATTVAPKPSSKPSEPDSDTVLRRIGPWREMQCGNGDVYYWNKFTGVVTWTHPKQLPIDSQNPGVTSVAAALHKMRAKDLKLVEEHSPEAAADMLAASLMMRSQGQAVRSQAELSHAASMDDDDTRDGDGGGGSNSREFSLSFAGDVPAVAALSGEGNHATSTEKDGTTKKKLSAIQNW